MVVQIEQSDQRILRRLPDSEIKTNTRWVLGKTLGLYSILIYITILLFFSTIMFQLKVGEISELNQLYFHVHVYSKMFFLSPAPVMLWIYNTVPDIGVREIMED